MSSTTLKDKYGDEVVIHDRFILYRNRSIDSACVDEIRIKGYRLTINSYKQNTTSPTMCIHFPSKEDAQNAQDTMLTTWYSTYSPDEKFSTVTAVPLFNDTTTQVLIVLFVAFVLRILVRYP